MAELRNLQLNELIPGQKYIIKRGFKKGEYEYLGNNQIKDKEGKIDVVDKITYGLNIFECDWEYNKLLRNLMEIIGDFHIEYISKNPKYKRLSEIIKEGSILMNRIKMENNKLCLRGDRETIIRTTSDFYDMINDLALKSIIYVSFAWCFYRAGHFKKFNIGETLTMPLPFSVTSYFKVSYNWLSPNEQCCLFKIIVPGNSQFAILEPFYNSNKKYEKGYEGEITLPPGLLHIDNIERIGLKERDVWYCICSFIPYLKDQAIFELNALPQCQI